MNSLFIAEVGHRRFSPPVFKSMTPGLKYPPHKSQYPHKSNTLTHFTAEGFKTHSSAQRPHCKHSKGSICQTYSSLLDLPDSNPPTPPRPSTSPNRAELWMKSLRFTALFSSLSFIFIRVKSSNYIAGLILAAKLAVWIGKAVAGITYPAPVYQ